jgi:hypothetical protein
VKFRLSADFVPSWVKYQIEQKRKQSATATYELPIKKRKTIKKEITK